LSTRFGVEAEILKLKNGKWEEEQKRIRRAGEESPGEV